MFLMQKAVQVLHSKGVGISENEENRWFVEELQKRFNENLEFFKINKRAPNISLCFSGVCANNEDLAKKRLKEFLPDNSTWDVNVVGTPEKVKKFIYDISSSTSIEDFIYCDLSQSIYHEEHLHSLITVLK